MRTRITLGHDEVSLHFQPLQTLLLRGTEWAATGQVTLPVLEEAKDYPDEISERPQGAAVDVR